MVGLVGEVAAFEEVPELLDGEIDHQELAIQRAIPRLRWPEPSGKECPGAPTVIVVSSLLPRPCLTRPPSRRFM